MGGQSKLKTAADLLVEIQQALEKLQPNLRLVEGGWPRIIEGPFTIKSTAGPVDTFEIRIVVNSQFPDVEPLVYETLGRIPKIPDRHVNTSGDCCVTVWETWLVTQDTSFESFLDGPLQEYFLNQFFFEKTGQWRLGQRAHGADGIIEAFAEVLCISTDKEAVDRYLQSLAGKPKGHHPCPCGSGTILRKCHQQKLHELYARITEPLARRMLKRLRRYTHPDKNGP